MATVECRGGLQREEATVDRAGQTIRLQLVFVNGKTMIAERSALPLEFSMTHPGVPHMSEKDAGETRHRLNDLTIGMTFTLG